MTSSSSGCPTSGSATMLTSLVVVLVLSTCILRAQSCMPMMSNMMMPMMEQAQNAMMFQASNSMFKMFFEDVGLPLFKLHVGGATALVSHYIIQTSPYIFAPETWIDTALQVGNLVVSTGYFMISLVETAATIIISMAQTDIWDMKAGFTRLLYAIRLMLSPNVDTTGPVALGADQQVALRLLDMNADKGTEEGQKSSRSSSDGRAAQDCLQELMCGLLTSDATSHLWQTMWTMVPMDIDQDAETPSLPQFCEGRQEEFSSCYGLVDDFLQTLQTDIDYYRYHYYNSSGSRYYAHQNGTIVPWSWAVFG